jgi:pyridoxal phosphate enzyme (YggS family)
MSAIEVQLAAVNARIASACARAGRPIESVQLIAVSKLHPPELIQQCYRAGQRDFGENYAQELRDKAVGLGQFEGLRWHAIGPLQSNKAKYVARYAHAFHALDRLEVAQELSRRRQGSSLRCYLEVNLAGESSKSGVAPEQAEGLIRAVRQLPRLEVIGLMCLPPISADPEASRPHFRALRALARALQLSELSMGTTADFEVAIEEGATAVRVGTAIFGERPTD